MLRGTAERRKCQFVCFLELVLGVSFGVFHFRTSFLHWIWSFLSTSDSSNNTRMLF